jgi:uroporphyrinogen-III synthase
MGVVYFTREVDRHPEVLNWCENNHHSLVFQLPFLITYLEYSLPAEFNWVFFTSHQHSLPQGCKVAVMGSGTARALPDGLIPDFVGSTTDATQIGHAFAQVILPTDQVVFPLSNQSNRSISGQLPSSQVHEIVAYTNDSLNVELPLADVYVITSPSACTGIMNPHFLLGKKIISFGPSTTDRLRTMHLDATITLNSISDNSILEAIKALI